LHQNGIHPRWARLILVALEVYRIQRSLNGTTFPKRSEIRTRNCSKGPVRCPLGL
jgi:hypothetical protein